MASRVEIANLALLALGSGSKITSLTDNSPAARAIYAAFDMARQAELRAHNWSFAIRRSTLPASATAPAWGFSLAYPMPADCLRMVEVNRWHIAPAGYSYVDSSTADFAIEGREILTDIGAPLPVRYVQDVTDEGLFDALFCEAFALRLGMLTAEQITNATRKKQSLQGDYQDALRRAVRANSIELPPSAIADDSWMLARL